MRILVYMQGGQQTWGINKMSGIVERAFKERNVRDILSRMTRLFSNIKHQRHFNQFAKQLHFNKFLEKCLGHLKYTSSKAF